LAERAAQNAEEFAATDEQCNKEELQSYIMLQREKDELEKEIKELDELRAQMDDDNKTSALLAHFPRVGRTRGYGVAKGEGRRG